MLASNAFLIASALLIAATGLIHSFLGERLIFSRWRSTAITAAGPSAHLARRHARILWASWHGITVFALFSAWLIATLPAGPIRTPYESRLALLLIATCIFVGSLVLTGTRGRHPGWLALFVGAGLLALGIAK